MKTLTVLVVLLGITFGCSNAPRATQSNTQAPEDSIRTAIQAHLAHKGNLNLGAFDTDVKQVTIQGDHATAEVEFRLKNGPGAMQLNYALQKEGDVWSVIESDPVGSNFSHPALAPTESTSGDGATAGATHSLADTLRSFKGDAGAAQTLPPGHPPLNSNSRAAAPIGR